MLGARDNLSALSTFTESTVAADYFFKLLLSNTFGPDGILCKQDHFSECIALHEAYCSCSCC